MADEDKENYDSNSNDIKKSDSGMITRGSKRIKQNTQDDRIDSNINLNPELSKIEAIIEVRSESFEC